MANLASKQYSLLNASDSFLLHPKQSYSSCFLGVHLTSRVLVTPSPLPIKAARSDLPPSGKLGIIRFLSMYTLAEQISGEFDVNSKRIFSARGVLAHIRGEGVGSPLGYTYMGSLGHPGGISSPPSREGGTPINLAGPHQVTHKLKVAHRMHLTNCG